MNDKRPDSIVVENSIENIGKKVSINGFGKLFSTN